MSARFHSCWARMGLVLVAIGVTWSAARSQESPTPKASEFKPNAALSKPKLAIKAAKIFTSAGEPIANGIILVSHGKIEKVGSAREIAIPEGYETIDHSDKFAMPGLIEAHCHVAGSGDLNDTVYQTNPELRVLDQLRPHNDDLKLAIAGGVTTVCYIPGSGSNMGGWGALLKTGPGELKDVLIRFPGVLKIAQAGNPERRNGEVGSGRMGMNFVIRQQLEEGRRYVEAWDAWEKNPNGPKPAVNLRLEYFKPLFHREIPVLVHTQQYQVVMSSIRILHDEMNLKIVIGHGTFDGYRLGEEVLKRNIPVMAGPRGFYPNPEDGQWHGVVAEYANRGVTFLGVNTDAPVIPQEELWFQGTMAVRYGWNEAAALRGLTIEAAKALMIEDRVGSLEPGKDADIVISTGLILDPRHYVVEVFIDGRSVYHEAKDGRRF
ncbi:amidohydrolase [Isosphaera pallida ATCC 43644]|uniref:Amidohydrolase n=1 Tax=Isosphaera pallida (strain ATCC 43644 / DSM 9630 / IS1B) TaxID=575540 RepID=E8R6E3_ISOPI|nr:amidohydrolase family protein [Isosphaera pallida]ADV61844.1 amidohydrolase [Isosphaera pallida ATCC 43644]